MGGKHSESKIKLPYKTKPKNNIGSKLAEYGFIEHLNSRNSFSLNGIIIKEKRGLNKKLKWIYFINYMKNEYIQFDSAGELYEFVMARHKKIMED
jgi:hypothetical protein